MSAQHSPSRYFRSRRHSSVAALVVVLGIALAPAASAGEVEEVDRLALAAVLLDGGDPARARRVLNEIDLDTEVAADEKFDVRRYHTLVGIVALGEARYDDAILSLGRVAREADAPPAIFVALARAYAGAERPAETLRALDAAGDAGRKTPLLFALRAHAHLSLNRPARALRSLRVGQRHFSGLAAGRNGARPLLERELFLLIELTLIQEALDRAKPWLATATEDEMLAFAAALLRAGAPESAEKIAEQARLQFPSSPEVRVLLAHAAAKQKHYTTAAHHFEHASYVSGELDSVADAAEMYRRAGRTAVALTLGAKIEGAEVKVRQRFGILLESERYDEAAALERRLSRLGMLADDDIRLALAYAHFRTGALTNAEAVLGPVKSARAFERAAQMRQAIAQCREESSRCP